MGAKWLGATVKRKEDPALLTGKGHFVDDIHLPGTLHAAFVRSAHAHARIRGVDTSAARAMPGVHLVLTFADLPQPLYHYQRQRHRQHRHGQQEDDARGIQRPYKDRQPEPGHPRSSQPVRRVKEGRKGSQNGDRDNSPR